MKKNFQIIDRRDFLKKTGLGAAALALSPALLAQAQSNGKLRIAQIGVGAMGVEDLKAISSHPLVEVVALCDVDSTNLGKAAADFSAGEDVFGLSGFIERVEKGNRCSSGLYS